MWGKKGGREGEVAVAGGWRTEEFMAVHTCVIRGSYERLYGVEQIGLLLINLVNFTRR